MLAATAAIAALLAGAGIAERSYATRREAASLQQIADAVGSRLLTTNVSDYWRGDPPLTCLIYRFARNDFALRLCFDPRGRLVLANDQRDGKDVLGNLLWRPDASPVRFEPAEIDHSVAVVARAQALANKRAECQAGSGCGRRRALSRRTTSRRPSAANASSNHRNGYP